jgi:hypothetical protein
MKLKRPPKEIVKMVVIFSTLILRCQYRTVFDEYNHGTVFDEYNHGKVFDEYNIVLGEIGHGLP